MGLQAIPIFRYSFYSFSYSLEFRGKRYQWYQFSSGFKRTEHSPQVAAAKPTAWL